MKKIIKGRKYDTETANLIDYFTYGEPEGYKEALYQKKTSEFFVCTSGRYSDNEIYPLSEEETKEWLEEYSDGDTYEKLFGEVEE